MTTATETIVFGGGCFWCTEAVFQELRGVISTMPGYSRGAEVIRIEYNPAQITFYDLLTVFFATHDPTSLNRQGADIGTQYRSAIFYTSEQQRKESEKFIKDLGDGIVTELQPLADFSPAEDYHRNFYKNNTSAPYCQLVINPKLEKVLKEFAELLKRP